MLESDDTILEQSMLGALVLWEHCKSSQGDEARQSMLEMTQTKSWT